MPKNDVLPAENLFHAQLAPHGPERWKSIPKVLEQLKDKAKKQGLWNLWLSGGEFQGMAGGSGGGLTNLEVSLYYPLLSERGTDGFIVRCYG